MPRTSRKPGSNSSFCKRGNRSGDRRSTISPLMPLRRLTPVVLKPRWSQQSSPKPKRTSRSPRSFWLASKVDLSRRTGNSASPTSSSWLVPSKSQKLIIKLKVSQRTALPAEGRRASRSSPLTLQASPPNQLLQPKLPSKYKKYLYINLWKSQELQRSSIREWSLKFLSRQSGNKARPNQLSQSPKSK